MLGRKRKQPDNRSDSVLSKNKISIMMYPEVATNRDKTEFIRQAEYCVETEVGYLHYYFLINLVQHFIDEAQKKVREYGNKVFDNDMQNFKCDQLAERKVSSLLVKVAGTLKSSDSLEYRIPMSSSTECAMIIYFLSKSLVYKFGFDGIGEDLLLHDNFEQNGDAPPHKKRKLNDGRSVTEDLSDDSDDDALSDSYIIDEETSNSTPTPRSTFFPSTNLAQPTHQASLAFTGNLSAKQSSTGSNSEKPPRKKHTTKATRKTRKASPQPGMVVQVDQFLPERMSKYDDKNNDLTLVAEVKGSSARCTATVRLSFQGTPSVIATIKPFARDKGLFKGINFKSEFTRWKVEKVIKQGAEPLGVDAYYTCSRCDHYNEKPQRGINTMMTHLVNNCGGKLLSEERRKYLREKVATIRQDISLDPDAKLSTDTTSSRAAKPSATSTAFFAPPPAQPTVPRAISNEPTGSDSAAAAASSSSSPSAGIRPGQR
jgi:hypothetical protein